MLFTFVLVVLGLWWPFSCQKRTRKQLGSFSGEEEPVSGVKDGSTARNGSVQRGDCLEQM